MGGQALTHGSGLWPTALEKGVHAIDAPSIATLRGLGATMVMETDFHPQASREHPTNLLRPLAAVIRVDRSVLTALLLTGLQVQ